ncbi:amidophosphoribosyltransferase [Candidatus Aciduliprofundum boonei]|uniref:Amidophosphoribosyltransferase n=1 Tax=Aciduliprofundum boonei (strain DSM 19572 / T469) TaxID=439481 RepID=B5ID36_ACIB4|nr:amidophosphoribosyltransferase [Candidatus Aciduliprofundum boonei]ADD09196.1 amidophosphoribosyltransferase [Aciduliprofundum boonei T469]EDY35894.1 amidophosphoribosyltransferase [Aciduliprofundum boonei T469]HII55840.1 amidophosphoribosyltransferase [Candidatus Aciduliprofundum boonei]
MVIPLQECAHTHGQRKRNEYCGIAGFSSIYDVSHLLYFSLRALQHRGQESAGIAIYSKEDVSLYKGMGLVHEVFNSTILESLKGNVGIGHVRYSTTGSSSIENAQPIRIYTKEHKIAVAHNGEIVNVGELKDFLNEIGAAFITKADSEVIARVLAYELSKHDVVESLKNMVRRLRGSFSLAILIDNRLFAIRDPLGIRPLVLGKIDGGYGLASESTAFHSIGGKFIRDVEPGEIVEITHKGFITHHIFKKKHKAHCMFEYVYFARADSVIDGRCVYDVRREIGRILAEEHPVQADFVVPVPDSGRAHAIGYSERSGIPYAEGLMKNRYVERTFILPSQETRVMEINMKLSPVKSVIKGKKIVLVDDSIVRGNTMRKIVKMLKEAGAEEVHVRVGSPPIIAPCYLGIDMKTRDQFIAAEKSVEEIREIIGADSLGYISIEGLVKAIGLPYGDLCLGCLTGKYPVQIKGEKIRFQSDLEEF